MVARCHSHHHFYAAPSTAFTRRLPRNANMTVPCFNNAGLRAGVRYLISFPAPLFRPLADNAGLARKRAMPQACTALSRCFAPLAYGAQRAIRACLIISWFAISRGHLFVLSTACTPLPAIRSGVILYSVDMWVTAIFLLSLYRHCAGCTRTLLFTLASVRTCAFGARLRVSLAILNSYRHPDALPRTTNTPAPAHSSVIPHNHSDRPRGLR